MEGGVFCRGNGSGEGWRDIYGGKAGSRGEKVVEGKEEVVGGGGDGFSGGVIIDERW